MIDVPPGDANGSFNGNIVTVWQMPLEDAGLLGVDKGAGGKFLILPPGYAEPIPDGYIPLQSDTLGGYALFRSNLKSHGDADVAEIDRLRQADEDLSARRRPPIRPRRCSPTSRMSISIRPSATTRASSSISTGSCRAEPWLDRDRAMIDPLQIARHREGQAVQPRCDATKALLDRRRARGAAPGWRRNMTPACRRSSTARHWTFPAPPELVQAAQTGFADPNQYPIDCARPGLHATPIIGIKRLGAGQFYLISIRDKDGDSYRRRQDLSPDRAAERAGRAVLVGDRL